MRTDAESGKVMAAGREKNSQPIVPAILTSGTLGGHLFWEVIYKKPLESEPMAPEIILPLTVGIAGTW